MNDTKNKYYFESDWINHLESNQHWNLYWIQQKIIESYATMGDTFLEIGVGSGFCKNYLTSKNHNIKTLDIDSNKNPDIVGNIVDYNFADKYDIILAFEVLEHIPLKEIPQVLTNVRNNCNKYFIVSVPDYYPTVFELNFKIPYIRKLKINVKYPKLFPYSKKMTQAHHWEVGSSKTTHIKELFNTFKENGFDIVEYCQYKSYHFIVMK